MAHTVPIFTLVVLRKNNKILLLKRAPDAKFAPNEYCIVGGAVEQGETFRDVIVREAKEEVGITINTENLNFIHVFHKETNGFALVVCAFECHEWEGEAYNVEPHKHTELLWADPNNLPEPMVPAHRKVIEYALQNIRYSEHQ